VSPWCICGVRCSGEIRCWLMVFGYLAQGLFAQTTRNPNDTVDTSLSGVGVVYIMDMRPPARSPMPKLIFWEDACTT
jgi:hypothetical protein